MGAVAYVRRVAAVNYAYKDAGLRCEWVWTARSGEKIVSWNSFEFIQQES